MDFSGWVGVRDALVSLWGWWREGGHLRAQLMGTQATEGAPQYREPFVMSFVGVGSSTSAERNQRQDSANDYHRRPLRRWLVPSHCNSALAYRRSAEIAS